VITLSRDKPQDQPAKVIEAALRMAPTTLPALVGVDLGAQGYAVVRVSKILPRDAVPQANARQEQAQYSQLWSAAEGEAYYNLLKERFKTQMLVARPAAGGSVAQGTSTR
jgi:peptidyl-prolyl cis-trans isomerase D